MRHSLRATAAAAVLAAGLLARPAGAAPAEAIATDKIKDLTASLKVVDSGTNFEELKKIGGDFATSYRLKRMEVTYKNPNRTRLEAKVAGIGLTIIHNGDMKLVKAPFRK